MTTRAVGLPLVVEGTARTAKLGALVQTADGEVWIDQLDAWPAELEGRVVRVRGTLAERDDVPAFVQRPGEPIAAGVPVEREEDLAAARRRVVLAGATWERAE